MKKKDERELECPNCGEKVRVVNGPPAAPCPNCGEKIKPAQAERIYGEAGKTGTGMNAEKKTRNRR